MRTAVFESGGRAHPEWRACFDRPKAIHIAHTDQEVLQVIRLGEAAAQAGRWVAMMLSYEAAAAFDPVMQAHQLNDFPLAWAAVFDDLAPFPLAAPPCAYEISA